MKVCESCKLSKPDNDYYGNEKCYKCIYKQKKEECKNKKYCKLCHQEITKPGENSKLKNARWKYCSSECAEIAAFRMRKNHWTLVAKKNAANSEFDLNDYWYQRSLKESLCKEIEE